MLKIFREHIQEIEQYCNKNRLSVNKFFSSAWAGNETSAILQYVDLNSERAQLGLLDDRPAPITLKVFLEDGKLRFEQTDITRKYLGADSETVVPARTTSRHSVRPSIPKRRCDLAYA